MTANVDTIYPGAPVAISATHASGALGSSSTDTPTGVTTLCTVGVAGAQGGRLSVLPLANNTATVMRLYRRKQGESATIWRQIDAKLLSAQTVSSTSPASPVDFPRFASMDFAAGDVIGFGTDAAASVPLSVDGCLYDLTQPA